MTAPRKDRKLAAILVMDVVGYSRLVGLDEAGTLERVKAHRIELAEPLIAEHHGRVVKLTGDGALVEFASAVDASNARSRFSAAWPSGRRPGQRIGASASASASVKRHREVDPLATRGTDPLWVLVSRKACPGSPWEGPAGHAPSSARRRPAGGTWGPTWTSRGTHAVGASARGSAAGLSRPERRFSRSR